MLGWCGVRVMCDVVVWCVMWCGVMGVMWCECDV